MGSTGIKEYTLKINGISKSIEDVTKLEKVVDALDASIKKVNDADIKSAAASRTKKAALTDEQKAAEKLAATQARLEKMTVENARAQIEANIALRERTREVTRQVQIESLAEGSLKAMGMQLTDLRNEYEALSAEERNNLEIGGQMLTQIQALDAEYKAARESTGNFRDSVGNYEKAAAGLTKLADGIGNVGNNSVRLAATLTGSNDVLGLFGSNANAVSQSTEKLQAIILTATAAQELYTTVTQDSTIKQGAAAVMDGVRAVQLRAKAIAEALATKNTIAATVAQKAFNLVAAANPYVLLALALVGVVTALVVFSEKTADATEKQKELNAEAEAWLGFLEAESASLKLVGDARVASMERNLRVLKAQEGKTKDIRALENEIAKEKQLNNARQRGLYWRELQDLEANRAKLAEYNAMLLRIKEAQARGDNKVMLDVDLNGNARKVKVEDALNIIQGRIDTYGKKVEVAVKLRTEKADLTADEEVAKATRAREDKEAAEAAAEKRQRAAEEAKQRREEAKRAAEEAAQARREAGDKEREAIRAAEDAKLKLLDNGYEAARKKIIKEYDNQINDLKHKLKNEANLTARARAAINDNIITLERVKSKELAALKKEYEAKELEDLRAAEDQRTALLLGMADRAQAEIKIRYDRQIADLRTRLETEKGLTETQVKTINEMIVNAEDLKNKELNALNADQARKRSDALLNSLEADLNDALDLIGDFTVRNGGGLKLIDVQATRQNLADANGAIDIYISGLREYLGELEKSHQATLSTLKEGTQEYTDELNKYAQAQNAANIKIKKAQKTQEENTKASTETQVEYYRDLFSKIADMATVIAEVVTQAMDTFNMALQAQIDELSAGLDVINEKYEAAKKQREDAVKNVEEIEIRFQAAGAGTSDAIKSQLADAMHARNEAEREEKRLLKEKEKREAEIQKKEKQMRRNDLIAGIAQGIANTAQGVTKMLSLAWPLNLVMAALVGVMGGVQVGIMAKQLSKLEDGGRISGPSHAQGGVRIPGTNIEVEGDEYVVNKKTTRDNLGLLSWLNKQKKTITLDDVTGFFNKPLAAGNPVKTYLAEGGQIPVIENTVTSVIDYDQLGEAMARVNLTPVVAVTDIIDAADQVTAVRDISGF